MFVYHILTYCRPYQVEKNSKAKVLIYGEVEGTSSTKNTHFEVSDLRHTITDNYYAENQGALLLYSKGSDHLVSFLSSSRLLSGVNETLLSDARSPFPFRHSDLNSHVDRVINGWRMSNRTSVLASTNN